MTSLLRELSLDILLCLPEAEIMAFLTFTWVSRTPKSSFHVYVASAFSTEPSLQA